MRPPWVRAHVAEFIGTFAVVFAGCGAIAFGQIGPPGSGLAFGLVFIALGHVGRTVEHVLYPEGSHTIAASGRPDRRIDRMTRVLDWFDRYLR